MNQLGRVLIIRPLHILVSRQHSDHIVLKKDHDAGYGRTFLLSKLYHSNIDIAEAEWVTSRLFIVIRVAIFRQNIRERWSKVTPLLLPASLRVHVVNRDHVQVADKHEIVVDDEVREELHSVVQGEELGLLGLNFGQGNCHSLEIEEVDFFFICDQ